MKQELIDLKNFIDRAVHDAERLTSNIAVERLIKMRGFNSERVRHLLNNLCKLQDTVYLDIGSYRGVSVSSALWGNKATGYAVDTFAYDYLAAKPNSTDHIAGTLRALKEFIQVFRCADQVTVICEDICKLDIKQFDMPINVCYYDAGIQEGQSYKAFNNIIPALSRYAIVVSSTLQNPEVNEGIEKAFAKNNITVAYNKTIRSRSLTDIKTWWNGVNIWLIEKTIEDSARDNKGKHDRKLAIEEANRRTKEMENA